MRLTDRVINDNNEKNRESEKKRAPYFTEELDGTQMGYAYDTPPKYIDLNTDKSIFDKADETSINTMKSVFDKTAIFHVNSKQ